MKSRRRFVHREIERVFDVASLVGVAKRGLAVAVAAALFAYDLDGLGKRHVVNDATRAAARLARALGIEAEQTLAYDDCAGMLPHEFMADERTHARPDTPRKRRASPWE